MARLTLRIGDDAYVEMCGVDVFGERTVVDGPGASAKLSLR
jgi:hypothetical protein